VEGFARLVSTNACPETIWLMDGRSTKAGNYV
jgi:hypothetical protein